MKHLFSLLICLSLVFVPFLCEPAQADDLLFDLNSMSLDELLSLKSSVDLAIMSNSEYLYQLCQGVYIVGENIPAGKCRLSFESSSIADFIWIVIYRDLTTYNAYYEYGKSDMSLIKLHLTSETST